MDIINTHIPRFKAKDPSTPPWIDAEVIHLLKKKESARKSAKKSKSTILRDKYRNLRRESKILIGRKFKEYTEFLGEAIKENSKKLRSYFRCKTKNN